MAEWKEMSKHQRAVFVAQHPTAAAMFFDEMISKFLQIIVRADASGPGVFGFCEAYYGMVEAQGRGMLHCHLLLWLRGNPNPQLLRDRITSDQRYREDVIGWLEANIKCELPDMTVPLVEDAGQQTERPRRQVGELDPQVEEPPNIDEIPLDEFKDVFRSFVRDLAIACNWHEHTDTCWKHLRPREPKDDQHCRMHINGSTRALTEVDPETQSILLRRFHPRINNFHDLVIFLLQCNMDIKYIGSGEAAKALVFYVTDYITKSNLAVHVGLDAIKYAIRQNEERFLETSSIDHRAKHKSAFVKSVNALMARQELSHQQVMSYLIGGGDHYRSHTFTQLPWRHLDHYVRLNYDEADASATGDGADRDEVVITVDKDEITVQNFILDYSLRSEDPTFESLSAWQYAELAHKFSLTRELRREERNQARQVNSDPQSRHHPLGRRPNERGRFKTEHPQHGTHIVRLRSVPYVVVPIGSAIPRPDRGPEEREEWCRAMLILFKPWRQPSDLKDPHTSWSTAFDATAFSGDCQRIMANMNVENECKDAGETYDEARREGRVTNPLLESYRSGEIDDDFAALHMAALDDETLQHSDNSGDMAHLLDEVDALLHATSLSDASANVVRALDKATMFDISKSPNLA
ncbi:hypothetical protein HYDPIDRAFT_33934 [Hydnomerulius pinastri MD-312]|uniref:Helitron helicase-like domain-containing protein n=1 Tax=Hydnomerulius pinastri MD-312 TaxID=994086 RepID=A0A0C9W791_9AGAM|nr:hypothetical protein HYDPIDRAFT_33934 [Hydnomerulius pinastri MD-312]